MRANIACVAIVTALASTACYSLKQVTLDDLGGAKSNRVWVTKQDQSVVLVEGPQVFRGKLVGFVDGKYRELPQTDLQQMKVRKLSVGRTASLIGASVLAFTVGVVLLAGGEDHFDPCAGDEDCVEMLRSGR